MRSHGYNDDPVLAACGISIEKQLTQVEGRILEAPKVHNFAPSLFGEFVCEKGFLSFIYFWEQTVVEGR